MAAIRPGEIPKEESGDPAELLDPGRSVRVVRIIPDDVKGLGQVVAKKNCMSIGMLCLSYCNFLLDRKSGFRQPAD